MNDAPILMARAAVTQVGFTKVIVVWLQLNTAPIGVSTVRLQAAGVHVRFPAHRPMRRVLCRFVHAV